MDTITVRNASLEDAPRILEIYSYYVEHTAITFEYIVPSLEEFQNRMKNTMKKHIITVKIRLSLLFCGIFFLLFRQQKNGSCP